MMEQGKSPQLEMERLRDDIRNEIDQALIDLCTDNPEYEGYNITDMIDYSGQVHEIVDSSVPVYSYDIMQLGTLSEIYQHESELGPAFDGSPTPINILAGAIYEVLNNTAWEHIQDRIDEIEDMDPEYFGDISTGEFYELTTAEKMALYIGYMGE